MCRLGPRSVALPCIPPLPWLPGLWHALTHKMEFAAWTDKWALKQLSSICLSTDIREDAPRHTHRMHESPEHPSVQCEPQSQVQQASDYSWDDALKTLSSNGRNPRAALCPVWATESSPVGSWLFGSPTHRGKNRNKPETLEQLCFPGSCL